MLPHLLPLLTPRRGHFRLESGHHGNLWLDLDALFLRPHRLGPFAAELAHRLARHKPAAICGPLVGGALLAQMIAAELEIDFYRAERIVPDERDALYPVKYRIPNSLRNRLRGKDIAVVDDVINAGSAVRGTISDLRSCGANPVAIGALLVLGTSASSFCAEQHLPLEHIEFLPNEVWSPSACPLCAAGMPLEDFTQSARQRDI